MGEILLLESQEMAKRGRLATLVLVVTPITFLMTQQMTRIICNLNLIAIFARLESDCKDAKFYHFIGEGKQFRLTL